MEKKVDSIHFQHFYPFFCLSFSSQIIHMLICTCFEGEMGLGKCVL